MRWSMRCVALSIGLIPGVAAAEDRFVTFGKVQIHYVERGPGDPIVLLHGRGGDIGTWIDSGVFDSLTKDYRVVALDLRGHGKSGKPHDPEQYGQEMGLDVIRLLDHLAIKQAHIVGYSLGSAVVSHLLTIHPDRFLTATLAGGVGRLSWTAEDAKRTELEASEIERYGVSPTTIRRLAPPNEPKPTDADIKKRSEAALANRRLDRHAIAAVLRSYGDQAITPGQAASVDVPTLAIIGALDPFVASVQELKTLRPELEVVIVDTATHGGERGVIRHPEFVRALRGFIQTHPSSNVKDDRHDP